MQYCRECGHKLEEGAAFCNECGTPVKANAENKANSVSATENNMKSAAASVPVPRKPISKKNKVLLIVGIALVVLLFAANSIIKYMLDKDRLIDNFEQALLDSDTKEIADLLTSNDKKLKIDEKSVKGFVKYFKENPDQVNVIVQELKDQSKFIDKQSEDDSSLEEYVDYYYEGSLVNLEKDGKFLFYGKYELNVPAVYLAIDTNYKDTVLYVDDKKVGTADSPNYQATFGPFMPGYHTIKASLSTDLIELNHEEEIFLYGYEIKESASIYLEADEVTFELPNYSDVKGTAKLFINGKDVGINLVENPTFGPVLVDGSMTYHVKVEVPWGTIVTEEMPIEEDYVYVSYLTEDISNSLMETAFNFEQEWAQAFTSGDVSGVTTATEYVKEMILDDSEAYESDEYAAMLEFLSASYDLDSLYLYYEDGSWLAGLSGENNWNEAYFWVGEEAGELEDSTEALDYQFVYDEDAGKWLVDYYESSWYYGSSNTKEFTVEEPVVYTSAWATEVPLEEVASEE